MSDAALDCIPPKASTKQLAAQLSVSTRTIHNWARAFPDFPRPLKLRQKLLWDVKAVAAWLKSREQEGAVNAL
jgi:predicted DNA-binding transcriptional regulator AlpA